MIGKEKETEVWLNGNVRSAWPGIMFQAIAVIVNVIITLLFWHSIPWLAMITAVLIPIGIAICAAMMITARTPRIVRTPNSLLLYLPGPKPIEVPLEVVECFLMSSGITTVPGNSKREVQTQNIVVRLAERFEEEWGHRDIPLNIGKWCQGQVTIRGLYCEPLNVQKIQELNVKLYEAEHGIPAPVAAPSENYSDSGTPKT